MIEILLLGETDAKSVDGVTAGSDVSSVASTVRSDAKAKVAKHVYVYFTSYLEAGDLKWLRSMRDVQEDVQEMKQRAQTNITFIYVKVRPI